MKKMHVWMTLVFAGLLLTSCAGVAHIKKDDSVDFSNYRTYAWVETKEEAKEGEKAKADLTEQKIRQAVNEELAREGWRETKAKPDVLLSYDVLVEKSVKERDDAVYSRPFNRYYFNPYTRRWGSV
ncbi:MAG TPA: DUF4136 domain-containing protein, partial [Chitinophagaceae bacterium]|nr:DUF4136 domain-containing protein [Chitinophagaceae bacterium]